MPTTSFVSQPDERIGDILIKAVTDNGTPERFVFVSAFASLTAVMRFKDLAQQTAGRGGDPRLVIGVDLGGTSKQVLKELASWPARVFVVKNSLPGITFHPKIYLLRWPDRALLIVGSNNLTDGGLFRNYEAASVSWYSFPYDDAVYAADLRKIERFTEPAPPTGNELTPSYLASLLALEEIPSEAEAQANRRRGPTRDPRPAGIFGFESIPSSPRLPPELQRLVLAARAEQHAEYARKTREYKKRIRVLLAEADPDSAAEIVSAAPQIEAPLAHMSAHALYVHLPQMKADNPRIPGEMRIPLVALEVAPDFWGWPRMYVDRDPSPRGGAATTEQRAYKDRQARWRTWAIEDPALAEEADVRMYMYENSSDFRMMIGALNKFSGRRGDIIRITPTFGDIVAYECALARAGTAEHAEWLAYMVNDVRNSDRRYGYA